MQVLLAVIDDLFQFAKTSLFGVIVAPHRKNIPLSTQTTHAYPQALQLFDKNSSAHSDLIQGQHYFIGQQHVSIYNDPAIGFDAAIDTLSYGSKVSLIKFGGRWAQVRCNGYEGWIAKDALREAASDVFPEFLPDIVYDGTHEATVQVRAFIKDEFNAGKAGIPLTDAEYVTYVLKRHNRTINWSKERPRIPGTWQRKLRGRSSIHIGVLPKKEAIMEYVVDDIGHVACVEAVFPDDSIQISSIGLYEEGMYTQEVLPKEHYRELRPVFIEVT